MRRNIYCLLRSLLFVSFLFLPLMAFAKEDWLKVQVNPPYLVQGGVMKVRLFPLDSGCSNFQITYKGKNIPAKELGDGSYLLVLGAGIGEKIGENLLKIASRCQGKKRYYTHRIYIKKKEYPKEFLKVSPKMVTFPPKILKRVIADQKAVKKACSKIDKKIYWSGTFIWPVKKDITSPFGLKRYFNNQPRSPHSGVDLRAKENTPILCPNDGRVVLVRDCYLSGKTVVINHGGGLYTLYAHLNKVRVKQGKLVKKGQVIGLSGSTGRITGPHLHWGLSLLGQRVDPVAFMNLFGRQ